MERSSGCISTAPAQGGTQAQVIGRSRGGLTTTILAVVDARGNLGRFILLPGQRHDSVGVAPVLDGIEVSALLADKACDSNAIRALIAERGAVAVIPSKADRSFFHPPMTPRCTNGVTWSKVSSARSRSIATRHDKTDTSFAAAIHLVVAVLTTR